MFQLLLYQLKHNVNLTKQLNEGFRRSVYWNEYKTKIESKDLDNNNPTRFNLDASFQFIKVKRLFVLAFGSTDNGDKTVEKAVIENKYDEIRKIAPGQGDD